MDSLQMAFVRAGIKLAFKLHDWDKKRAVEEAVARQQARQQPLPDPWQ